MVQGLYFHHTEAELLAMREEVLAQMQAARTGDRFTQTAGHGRAWTKDNLSYQQLCDELTEINAALKTVNPDRYGRRVTRMLADFRDA